MANNNEQNMYFQGTYPVEDSVHEEFDTEREKLAFAFARIKDMFDKIKSNQDEFSVDPFTFNESITQLPDNEKISIQRLTLPSDYYLKINKARVGSKDNTKVTGLKVIVYDHTNDQEVYSTEENVLQIGEPLAESEKGIDVEFFVKNESGERQDVQALIEMFLENDSGIN